MRGATNMRLLVAVASLLFVTSLASWGQDSHRPVAGAPPPEAAPTGAINPELETMTRAVAVQARPGRAGYFPAALARPGAPPRGSRELQPRGDAPNSTPAVNAQSLA